MVLTGMKMTAFLDDNGQMEIPHTTVIRIQHEEVNNVKCFGDFDKDTHKKVTKNIETPCGCIPDLNSGAAMVAMIPTPLFLFGAKSQI